MRVIKMKFKSIFNITVEGDKYNITLPGMTHIVSDIEGTIQEIALLLFEQCIVGNNSSWPPFGVIETEVGILCITTDIICQIDPEPDPAFWDELNKHFQRFMALKAFI